MRIGLTLEGELGSTDVVLDCDDDCPLEIIERALAEQVGVPVTVGCGETASALTHGMRIPAPPIPDVHNSAAGFQLHVIGGPNAGTVLDLPWGAHVLGRTGDLSWNDESVSRSHLRFDVTTDGVLITDLGSSNGTWLGAIRCTPSEPVIWQQAQLLEAGDSAVALRVTRGSDAVIEPAAPGWRAVVRPPRIRTSWLESTVNVPQAPATPRKRRLPLVTVLVPLLMGVAMATWMHNMMFLAFAVMSPVMLVANYVVEHRGTAREQREAALHYLASLAESERRLQEALAREQERLRDEQPDPADARLTAALPGRRLWERRRGDDDFLLVRIGLADRTAAVKLTGAPEPVHQQVRLVPHGFHLAKVPIVGIAGPNDPRHGCLRWIVGQLATYHAPEDLSLVFLTPTADQEWRWLRWLPHLRSTDRQRCEASVGNDPTTVVARVEELLRLIGERESALLGTPSGDVEQFVPVVVIMNGYRALRALADVAAVVGRGPAVAVYSICADESVLTLPEATQAVVTVDPNRSSNASLRVSGLAAVESILLDQVSLEWAQKTGRSLAPFAGVSARDDGSLPKRVRLLDLLGLDVPTPESVRAGWALAPSSTTMLLGAGVGGNVSLDLRADGPHGLVAGMTGSGKSELLQTMIASLAVANRPDWLNFVLIDYKGDSAFKDCARLPHTVGKVTDLNPFLVQRALASLEAELVRRKQFLADAMVKDIEDYHLLLGLEPARQALPRLVIVIDEFAELAKELPTFMAGLVSIAQLGRSLGVHLLLATQRPSGVISPAIRANTNMRISLRVADGADSVDVLACTEAARIDKSLPGRGWARLGAGELIAFQAARVGGRRPAPAVTDRAPVVYLSPWEAIGYPAPSCSTEQVRAEPLATDLGVLVAAIREAAAQENLPPARLPWLEPLPALLLWDEVEVDRSQAGHRLPPLPFGRSDVPQEQRQHTACFDLAADGHLYLVGSSRSGRSQALRALAASIGVLTKPTDLHLYGLDCGTGALNAMATLPHCGAVVSRSESTRAKRLLERLALELVSRQKMLAHHGYGDVSEQREAALDPVPHIVVMLDGWEGFTAGYGDVEDLIDIVLRLLREGASAGIHLIITGDRSLLTNSRTGTANATKFVLRLAEKSDYLFAGLNPNTIPSDVPPGRCFGPGMVETQVFLLHPDAAGQAQAAVLRRLGTAAADRHRNDRGPRPFRLDALPGRVSLAQVQHLCTALPWPEVVVGVGGDELAPIGLDTSRSGSFLVAGPPGSGRSSVLLGAAQSALQADLAVLVLVPRPSPLRALSDAPGIVAVLNHDTTSADLEGALAAVPGRLLIVVDDAECLPDAGVGEILLSVLRAPSRKAFLLVGGSADGLAAGFGGWLSEVRKSSRGLLLSPRSALDGDLIGLRLPRSSVGGPVTPGRGIVHLGDGVARVVATLAPPG